MSSQYVISDLWWEPSQGFDVRSATVLSDSAKIRLDPAEHAVKLKLNALYRYPTDVGLYVRAPEVRAAAVRQLRIIEVDSDVPTGTSLGYRIWDGTSDLYWDGAAWVAAGAGQWNTLAEVNAHLDEVDVSDGVFSVTVNLVTTDGKVSPVLRCLSVLWYGDVEWEEDALLDSLTADIQSGLDFTADLALPPLPAASASIDLADYSLGELSIQDAVGAYNHTADSEHKVNLLSGYAGGILTLSSPIPISGVPFLQLTVRPQVAFDTSQDFTEVAEFPQVSIRQVDAAVRRSPIWGERSVLRADTGEGVSLPAPTRATYELEAEVRAIRARELSRLVSALRTFLRSGPTGEAGPFIRSRATGIRYVLTEMVDESRLQAEKDAGDVRVIRLRFRLSEVTLRTGRSRSAYAIGRLLSSWSYVDREEEIQANELEAPVPLSGTETVTIS